jgi:putative Mg2+ transporter-C (MgtC) family protein
MHPEIMLQEIAIRLGLASLAGIVLGLNRWLHHKSAGVRTHAIVSIGAALSMLAITHLMGADAQSQSRVFQGIIQGVGFLGAGIILHQANTNTVKGLTTAASIWTVAILGASFGAGETLIGVCGLVAIITILLIGRPLEMAAGKIFGVSAKTESDQDD